MLQNMSFAYRPSIGLYLSLLGGSVTVEGEVDSAIFVVLVGERDAGAEGDLSAHDAVT